MSRPNSKKHSGNKIEIKIEVTYAFSNRIPVWESGRSVIKGGQYLTENIKKAEEFFEEAKKLAQINGEHLKIEYAHSIFGLAEVKRLKKDINAAKDYYNEAHGLFQETEVLWGIEKTKKGIDMTNDSSNEILFMNIP